MSLNVIEINFRKCGELLPKLFNGKKSLKEIFDQLPEFFMNKDKWKS